MEGRGKIGAGDEGGVESRGWRVWIGGRRKVEEVGRRGE